MNKLSFSIDKLKIIEESNDSQMTKIKMWIAKEGNNHHNLPISKEALLLSKKTLAGKPVLCNYDKNTKQFKGHELEEIPVGVFLNESEIYDEYIDGELWTVADCYIWKKYFPEIIEVFKNNKGDETSISMEIAILDMGENEHGECGINLFSYTGVTLIGVEPAIPNAKGVVMKFSEIVKKAKELNFENSVNIKNRIKEDKQMAKAIKDKNVQKIDKIDEKTVEKVEEFSEIIENSETEKVDTEVVEVVETEIIKEVIAEVEVVEPVTEVIDEPVVEVVTEPIIEEVVKTDVVEPEVKEEFSKDDSKSDKEVEDLKELVFNLNEKVKDLEKEITDKNTEIESLATFKSEREKEVRSEKVSELFNKFSDDLSKAEIEEWKEKELRCDSFESFKKDISEFMLDKVYHKINSDEKSTFAKMHIVGGTKEDEPTKEENLWTRLSAKK